VAVRSEFAGGQVVGHQARVNRANPEGFVYFVGFGGFGGLVGFKVARLRGGSDEKRQDIVIGQGATGCGGWIAADMSKAARGRVEAIQATADGADPDEAAAVLSDGPDLIVAQAGRVGRVVLVAGKAVGCAVEKIKAIVSADPEATGAVLIEGEDAGAGERVGIGGVMEIADETVGRVSIAVETVFRADPQLAAAVSQEDINPGIADRGRVAFDRYINGKVITVEFIEAGFGAEPQEAEAVAGDGKDRILRKALFDGEGAEEKMRTELGGEREGGEEGDGEKDKGYNQNSQKNRTTKMMGIIGIITRITRPAGVR